MASDVSRTPNHPVWCHRLTSLSGIDEIARAFWKKAIFSTRLFGRFGDWSLGLNGLERSESPHPASRPDGEEAAVSMIPYVRKAISCY